MTLLALILALIVVALAAVLINAVPAIRLARQVHARPRHVGGQTPVMKSSGGGYLQNGSATLVAGVVTVAGVELAGNENIMVCHQTPIGTMGILDTDVANRVAGNPGSFVITSDNALDLSVVSWAIMPRGN